MQHDYVEMKDSGLKWLKCKETLNADSLNSKHRILKLKTESCSAREELLNDMQHDYVETKDSGLKWQKCKETLNIGS